MPNNKISAKTFSSRSVLMKGCQSRKKPKCTIIQMRWKLPSDAPDPNITRCKLVDVRKHLTVETPAYSPEEREEAIHRRRVGYQMRQHW